MVKSSEELTDKELDEIIRQILEASVKKNLEVLKQLSKQDGE
jgi:hypothetical protein